MRCGDQVDAETSTMLRTVLSQKQKQNNCYHQITALKWGPHSGLLGSEGENWEFCLLCGVAYSGRLGLKGLQSIEY